MPKYRPTHFYSWTSKSFKTHHFIINDEAKSYNLMNATKILQQINAKLICLHTVIINPNNMSTPTGNNSHEASHYVVTAHPPGAVLLSAKCNFLSPESTVRF